MSYSRRGTRGNNIPLQAGDVVTVPHAGIVYVLGAVNRPGGFVMANDRTAAYNHESARARGRDHEDRET